MLVRQLTRIIDNNSRNPRQESDFMVVDKNESENSELQKIISMKNQRKQSKSRLNATKKKKTDNIAYYTIPVDFEITGNFLGYIKFKRAVSKSNKMLNFDKETIKVVKGNTTGTIKAKGT